MLTKDNILDYIRDLQKEADEIKECLEKTSNSTVKKHLRQGLWNVEDNLYRYKLQARAWGLEV